MLLVDENRKRLLASQPAFSGVAEDGPARNTFIRKVLKGLRERTHNI
jgi:hypothetical protein